MLWPPSLNNTKRAEPPEYRQGIPLISYVDDTIPTEQNKQEMTSMSESLVRHICFMN